MVLRGRAVGIPQSTGAFPQNLSIEQFSAAIGRQLGVLYQRSLGDTSEISGGVADPLALSAAATGGNLILNGGMRLHQRVQRLAARRAAGAAAVGRVRLPRGHRSLVTPRGGLGQSAESKFTEL
jgi:hypothetical protein